MSLTKHLQNKNSHINKYFEQNFPNVASFQASWNSLTTDLKSLLPPVGLGKPEYHIVGMAIDYRIRLLLQPYKSAQTVASQVQRFQGERPTFSARQMESPNFQAPGRELIERNKEIARYAARLWSDISSIWDQTLGKNISTGIDSIQTEVRLAKLCVAFSYFEHIVRNGRVPHIIVESEKNARSPEEFLDSIRLDTVEDVLQLFDLFKGSEFKDIDIRRLFLNPSFSGSKDVGGADADFILNDTLWELKTTIDPQATLGNWPRQILGYLFLDYEDQFKVNSVGVYLVRQGTSIKWPWRDIVRLLGGREDFELERWRAEFRNYLLNARDVRAASLKS